MKVTDYIVSFFIEKGVTDVFGYPGGMITHFMDSLSKYSDSISAHLNYHEQASSFCACGYASVKRKPGVAYATSGPGATNLITGIANAYYDSLPCIFITGQVNTFESKGNLKVRQKGFQETDIVSIVESITKYSSYVQSANDIRYELEKAYCLSMEGRPGPVLLDIPFDVQKSDINPSILRSYQIQDTTQKINYKSISDSIYSHLVKSKKPLFLVGAGISKAGVMSEFRKLVDMLKIPVVSSMIATDTLPDNSLYKFGFVGAYGHRYANIILEKCDLIICLGSRLDTRQTGVNVNIFAKNSKLIRVDISSDELENKIKSDEIGIACDLKRLLPLLISDERYSIERFEDWLLECTRTKQRLLGHDDMYPNAVIRELSNQFPEHCIVTTDVGQNQVWVSQSMLVKENQQILYSGGHGAMGYSLPSAIGAYYASKNPVISFNGDGGLQMNIQELQFISREKLPIKIIVLNNHSLGMIRHFQEMYFDGRFTQTIPESSYTNPDFCKIASAYGIRNIHISDIKEIENLHEYFIDKEPLLINIECGDKTYVFPKLGMGRPTYDQEPLLEREELSDLLHGEIDP